MDKAIIMDLVYVRVGPSRVMLEFQDARGRRYTKTYTHADFRAACTLVQSASAADRRRGFELMTMRSDGLGDLLVMTLDNDVVGNMGCPDPGNSQGVCGDLVLILNPSNTGGQRILAAVREKRWFNLKNAFRG